jgi:hypothetical protein
MILLRGKVGHRRLYGLLQAKPEGALFIFVPNDPPGIVAMTVHELSPLAFWRTTDDRTPSLATLDHSPPGIPSRPLLASSHSPRLASRLVHVAPQSFFSPSSQTLDHAVLCQPRRCVLRWSAFPPGAVSMVKIYVGNLKFSATEQEVREMFEPHGQVDEVSIAMDRETGRSRGFAFVSMASDDQAKAAMSALNGKEIGGRTLVVNEARPKTAGSGGGGGGGYRERGGYGGGGGHGGGGHGGGHGGGGRGGRGGERGDRRGGSDW